jgi:hypothetical protein
VIVEWEKWRIPGRSFDTDEGYVMRFPEGVKIKVDYEATTVKSAGAIHRTLQITTHDMEQFKNQTREWLTRVAARQGWEFTFEDD